ARYEVGAGPVVREPHPGPKDLGGHRRGRRLAVRRRDQCCALRQPGGEAVDRGRVELPEELPRDCGAAPAAGEAREASSGPRGENLSGKRHAHVARAYPLRVICPGILRTGDASAPEMTVASRQETWILRVSLRQLRLRRDSRV